MSNPYLPHTSSAHTLDSWQSFQFCSINYRVSSVRNLNACKSNNKQEHLQLYLCSLKCHVSILFRRFGRSGPFLHCLKNFQRLCFFRHDFHVHFFSFRISIFRLSFLLICRIFSSKFSKTWIFAWKVTSLIHPLPTHLHMLTHIP